MDLNAVSPEKISGIKSILKPILKDKIVHDESGKVHYNLTRREKDKSDSKVRILDMASSEESVLQVSVKEKIEQNNFYIDENPTSMVEEGLSEN